jgi:hypothetical protein
MSEETLARAVMEFQNFAGLNLTGKAALKTKLQMRSPVIFKVKVPRCPVLVPKTRFVPYWDWATDLKLT